MWIKRFFKAFQWLWWTVGSLIIGVLLLFALLLNIARIATPWLNRHPQVVLRQIHDYWPGRIQFQNMHWSWSWMSPQVVLNNVSISMASNGVSTPAAFYAQHLRLALNLIKSIEHMHVELNAVEVHGTDAVIRQESGGFFVNGYFVRHTASHQPLTLNSILHAFSTIKVGELILSKVDVQLYLQGQKPMAVHVPYLLFSHQSDYRAYGDFSITPKAVQTMRFWAREDESGKHGALGLQFQHIDIGHIRTWAFVHALLKHINKQWQPLRRLSTDLSGNVWMRLEQDRISQLQTQLMIHQATLVAQGQLKEKSLGDLSANVAYVRQSHQWQLSADQMTGYWNGQVHPLGAFQLTHDDTQKHPQWQFVGNNLWLGVSSHPVWTLLLPKANETAMLQAMQPKGWLSYVSFDSAQAKLPWQLQLQFKNVQWQPYHKIPGVIGLSGEVDGSQNKGIAHLTLQHGQLNYPYVFDQTWSSLDSAIDAHWSYKPEQSSELSHWQIAFDHLAMQNPTMAIQTSGTFDGVGPHAPVAHLHGHFHFNDVAQVGHYIPIIKIKPKLHQWLASSFSQGFVNDGELIIQGPLNKFPYEHHEGHFLAMGDMHGITMRYDPHWPAIQSITGRLIFENDGMFVDHASAILPGVQLSDIKASLPHFKQGELTIDNGMQGNLAGVSQFLVSTPLSVAKVFQSLQGQGDFSGQLHLFLPLKDLSDDTKVDGSLAMHDATWQAKAWNSLMTQVNGQIHFTQAGVDAPTITGRMFDRPVVLRIGSVPVANDKKSITEVQLTGVLPVANLMHAYVPLLEPFVSGQTRLTMMLHVYNNLEHQANQLSVDSDLQGVTIHLPDVLGKDAQTQRLLHIQMAIGDTSTVLHASYGQYVKARSVLKSSAHGERLVSQQVTVGQATIPEGNDQGVAFAVNMPTLSLNRWYDLYEKTIANAPVSANPLTLTYGSVQLDHADIYHQDLTGIHVVVKQADQQWLWRIMSSRVSGVGSIPIHKGMQPWHMQLKYVHLRAFPDSFIASQKQQAQQSTFMPSQIPQMDVDIKDFSYDKYALHTLGFNVNHPTSDSIRIHPLYLGDANLHLQLQLEGKNINDFNPFWHIYGKVEGNDFGQGLQSLGLPAHLDNTQGSIDVNAYVHQRWPVSPWSKLSKVLNATANVHLTNGSITGLSSSLQNALAALKVVNSLSIQSLPARLSSKAKPGSLYFTQLTAAAALYYEKWRLQGLTLKAPDMLITASGEGQVANRSLDVWLKVEPHLTGSAPVIAAIAFNPVIGIASWFVNKLVVSPIVSKAAGKEYHIFGQWSDIKVSKVNAR